MAKTSAAEQTNDFFKPDYFKVPDFGQFQADFNRWVGDFSKSFTNGKTPSVDLEGVFAYRQAFLGLSINEGASVSFVLLIMVLALTVVFFRLVTRRA